MTAAQPGWEAQFEGQRPPFEPGNEAAVRHGAFSQKRVERAAEIIGADLLERYPHVRDFPESVAALARVEGITKMMASDIAKGLYNKQGELKASLLARWTSAENTAARLRASLGMTPESEASVARDRAAAVSLAAGVDLHAIAARGGAAMAARDARELGRAPEDHDGEEH